MNCADCKHHNCYKTGQNCTRTRPEEIDSLYSEEELRIMRIAAKVEGEHYMQAPRIEEAKIFALEYGAKKIGLAFCLGLSNEAKLIKAYLAQCFEVHSVCCKTCGIPKTRYGLTQINVDRAETMCNPKIQAKILADCQTELNFTIGLCVGHDMLFQAASTVPVSSLITKDRVLSHNPAAAVYSRYWRNRLGIRGDFSLSTE